MTFWKDLFSGEGLSCQHLNLQELLLPLLAFAGFMTLLVKVEPCKGENGQNLS